MRGGPLQKMRYEGVTDVAQAPMCLRDWHGAHTQDQYTNVHSISTVLLSLQLPMGAPSDYISM